MTQMKAASCLLLLVVTPAAGFTSPTQQSVAKFAIKQSPVSSSTSLRAIRLFQGRGRVVKDPKTGFYRPAKSIPPLPTAKKVSDDPSLWDQTKEGFYNAVDGITGLTEAYPFVKQEKEGLVSGGYSDLERKVFGDAKGGVNPFAPSPGQRLAQEYRQQRCVAEEDTSPPNTSLWSSVKGVVYSAVDFAAATITSDNADDDGSVITKSAAMEHSKPLVRETIASLPLQKAITELESTSNPVAQIMARRTLDEYQRRQQQETTDDSNARRQQAAETIKQTIVGIGQAATETIDVLVELPGKATSTAQKISLFLQRLPLEIQRSWRAIMNVPTRITKTTQQLQSSMEETVESSRQAVQEIAMIPTKAQQRIIATRKSVVSAVQAVDDFGTKTKVLVGLEKPVPKPPKIAPPKPMTVNDIGLKVAADVSKGLLQASLWAGKEAAVLSWKGANLAVSKGYKLYKEKEAQIETDSAAVPVADQLVEVTAEARPTPSIIIEKNNVNLLPLRAEPKAPFEAMPMALGSSTVEVEPPRPTRSVTEQQAEIDRQVDNALRLAEEALGIATSNSRKKESLEQKY